METMPNVLVFTPQTTSDYNKKLNEPEYFITQEAYAYSITFNKKFPWLNDFNIQAEPYHDRLFINYNDNKHERVVRFIINNLPFDYIDVRPVDKPKLENLNEWGMLLNEDSFQDYIYHKETYR